MSAPHALISSCTSTAFTSGGSSNGNPAFSAASRIGFTGARLPRAARFGRVTTATMRCLDAKSDSNEGRIKGPVPMTTTDNP